MDKNIRTFGDYMKARPWSRYTATGADSYNACRICRKSIYEAGALWKYSVRHYLCDECIAQRVNEVLPEVKRHERWQKRWRAATGKQ